MTAAVRTADLLGSIADVDDAVAGLELLASSQPLWSIDRGTFWADMVARTRAFAERWDAPARAAGWTTLDLYGANRRAPGARAGSLGAAFLVARSAHSVLEVGRDAITVVTRAGSRLRIFRRAPDPDCALAWELSRPADAADQRRRGVAPGFQEEGLSEVCYFDTHQWLVGVC